MAKNNITNDIIKTANTIRKKYNILKSYKVLHRSQLEDTFKSLSKPLNELVKHTANIPKPENKAFVNVKRLKLEKIENNDTDDDDDPDGTVRNDSTTSEEAFYSENDDGDDGDYAYNGRGNISSKYLLKVKNDAKDVDNRFGVRVVAGQFVIGASKLTIIGNDLTLDDTKKYIGSEGLYELMFMKNPKAGLYNQTDLDTYCEIIKYSNACRRNYSSENAIAGNRSYKYTKIIKPLIHSGSGMQMMQLNNHNIDYTYWDDPNELVDRLRLLFASKHAGNNSHNNEIILIIEELREAGIIK